MNTFYQKNKKWTFFGVHFLGYGSEMVCFYFVRAPNEERTERVWENCLAVFPPLLG